MLVGFLALSFGISLAGFAGIRLIPGAQSPETARGLPVWLLTVWGPSLAAMILAARDGTLPQLLGRVVQVSTVPVFAWALVAAPLAMLGFLQLRAAGTRTALPLRMAATMVAFNLLLGPLGEELGWRGVMQEGLTAPLGWLGASIVTGVVWLVWHLPLWTIDSPHAQIDLRYFAGHCMAYSVIIGAAYAVSGGSILPAILIHLTVNLASNWATFAGMPEPNDWFRVSLVPYLGLAVLAVLGVAILRL